MTTMTRKPTGRRSQKRKRRSELPLSKFKFRLLQNPQYAERRERVLEGIDLYTG
jgi:hypothetical protein